MDQHGISKLDLKRQNRMHVLKILKQRGPTSRIDIAGELELTRAAVTIITNEMIEQGIIVELGEYKHVTEKPPRGRKKILIDINHNCKLAVGIAIECENISVGLSTLSGAVLDKKNMSIDDMIGSDGILGFITDAIRELLAENCIDDSQLLGVGVGVYPEMFRRIGVPAEHNVPDYSGLRKLLEEKTGLPVVIDNSVKGMAMANIDFLKDKDAKRRNIAFLQYGESMHFVVTNLNDPIVSYDNRTDFIDRIIINPASGYVSEDGRRGCSRVEITPSAIVKKVAKVFSAEATPYLYKLLGGDKTAISLLNINESFKKQDAGTVKVINEVFDLTAVLLNNLYYTTNPQKIVIHNLLGFDAEVRKHLFKAIERIIGRSATEKIAFSFIDDKQHFLSGCALVIRELFFDKGGFAVRK